MYADPDGDPMVTKVQCSLDDAADFIVNNELFPPPVIVDEIVVSAPTVALVTLDEDEETVEYLTNDNPFCDVDVLDIPEHLLPRAAAKDDIIILSDEDDESAPSSLVELFEGKNVNIKPMWPKKEPDSCNNSQTLDPHHLALQKFANYLSEHDIPDIRSSVNVPLQTHADFLQPNIFSGVSNILGTHHSTSPRCSDDIAVRDNTIQVDLDERVSFKTLKKLRKQAKKMNRLGKIRREEKKKKKSKKMKQKLVLDETTEGEVAAAVAEEHAEEVEIQLVDPSAHGVDVDRDLSTPTVQLMEDVEMLDEKEMDSGNVLAYRDLFGDDVDNKDSAKEPIVGGISRTSYTEEPGVGVAGGEEVVGMEVEEFSFIEDGDFDVHSSKLTTSTPHKSASDALPLGGEVEDFFAHPFFVAEGDSNEVSEISGGSHSTSLVSEQIDALKKASPKNVNEVVGASQISDSFMQMMEEFDKDSGNGESAQPIPDEKGVQRAPALVIDPVSCDIDNTEGIKDLSLGAQEAVDVEKKATGSDEQMDESGVPAASWSPDNMDDDTIVLDSFVEEESEKTNTSNEEIDLIEIDDDEGVNWRMVNMERGRSYTKCLFSLYRLPPHNGNKRDFVVSQIPPNIPLEPASLPRIFPVPPPVVGSELGPTMFGVPLDFSIMSGRIELQPFTQPSTSGNAKKRVHVEKPKRPPLNEQLGVTSDSWKPRTYTPPPVRFTVEDQWHINARPRITEQERKLQEQGVIKEYGILPRDQYKFPFDPYAGMYWPIFQPFDGVDFDSKDDTDAADVKNQLTNQTVCNYISKQELLCDGAPNKWAQSFLEADRMTPEQRKKTGRFANRVAYARKINDQSRDEMRDSDRRRQREQEERRMEQEKIIAAAEVNSGEDEGGERLKATEKRIYSMRMVDHVRENIVDEYSSVDYRCGNRKKCLLPSYWFQVPTWQYIPANDRRTYLCQVVNHFNSHTAAILQQLQQRGGRPKLRAEDYVRHVMRVVMGANYVQQATATNQLRLLEKDRILAKKRQKMLDIKFPVGSTVSLQEVREFVKLQDWEEKYWTFIWDNLASIFKTLPPISFLINEIKEPLDEAFKQLARPSHREEYHKIYKRHKEDFLDHLRRNARR